MLKKIQNGDMNTESRTMDYRDYSTTVSHTKNHTSQKVRMRSIKTIEANIRKKAMSKNRNDRNSIVNKSVDFAGSLIKKQNVSLLHKNMANRTFMNSMFDNSVKKNSSNSTFNVRAGAMQTFDSRHSLSKWKRKSHATSLFKIGSTRYEPIMENLKGNS